MTIGQAVKDALRSVAPLAEQHSPGGNLIRPDAEAIAAAVEEACMKMGLHIAEDTAKKVVDDIRAMIHVKDDEDVVDAVKGELVARDQVIAEQARQLEIANTVIDTGKQSEDSSKQAVDRIRQGLGLAADADVAAEIAKLIEGYSAEIHRLNDIVNAGAQPTPAPVDVDAAPAG